MFWLAYRDQIWEAKNIIDDGTIYSDDATQNQLNKILGKFINSPKR